MNNTKFNRRVIAHLRQTGRESVAEACEQMDLSMSAMSSADVAQHENLPLKEKNVPKVAVLRDEWVTVHKSSGEQ